MFKIIRKADIALFFVLVTLGIVLSILGLFNGAGKADGSSPALVKISVAGNPYGTYDLSTNQEIEITNGQNLNKVIIKDNEVQMIEANCHNKVCIKQGRISKPGQTIICLPNRVLVQIEGASEGGDPDVISG